MGDTTAMAEAGVPLRAARYRELFAVPEFRILAGGSALHLIANMLTTLALSVVIYQATSSPVWAAMAMASGFLPHLFGAAFLLAIADRYRPRRTLVVLGMVRAGLAFALAFGQLPVVAMLLLVITVNVFQPVNTAVRTALLPEVLSGDAYVLGRSVHNMIASSAQIVGLALGSVVLAVLTPTAVFVTVAIACLITAAAYQLGLANRPARGHTARSTVRQTRQVNGLLLRQKATRGLLLAQWLPTSLVAGAEALYVPYAIAHGVPDAAGVLLGAAATGVLVGEVVVARFIPPALREKLAFPLALLMTTPHLIFVLQPEPKQS